MATSEDSTARPWERLAGNAYRSAEEAWAEIRALKARRCDGCAWYRPCDGPFPPADGECMLPHEDEAGMLLAEPDWELLVDADHYCAAWTARDLTVDAQKRPRPRGRGAGADGSPGGGTATRRRR
jgi:hypothetical protein